jgi:hypothetical protein
MKAHLGTGRPPKRLSAPETKNPATGATAAGGVGNKSRSRGAQATIYSAAVDRAIVSYRVGPDLVIQAFAFAEQLA